MEKLTRTDLNKLANLCKAGYYEARAVAASADATGLEKALANHEAEYMVSLLEKIDRITNSGAKRVEITVS